ncbi:MAG: hypothetical protein IPG77_04835 [Betaproteobacteria bacterium]|nr:hypothetical protein [Betaproteobacteria bacterium]
MIAKQCGTSAAVIQLHCDHAILVMYAKDLAGAENEEAELTKLVNKYADLL